jgi:hypothetical protein
MNIFGSILAFKSNFCPIHHKYCALTWNLSYVRPFLPRSLFSRVWKYGEEMAAVCCSSTMKIHGKKKTSLSKVILASLQRAKADIDGM